MQTDNSYAVPQLLRWGPVDGEAAGIVVWAADGIGDKSFIPWIDVQSELQSRLRSQLFIEPDVFSFELRDHHARKTGSSGLWTKTENVIVTCGLGYTRTTGGPLMG